MERYFALRVKLCYRAQPVLAARIDVWDLNYIFFCSFENALLSFELGRGSFRSFLLAILSHEIIAFYNKEGRFDPQTVSLDGYVDRDGTLTFHDVVSSPEESPSAYYERAEAFEQLAQVMGELTEEEVAVASLRLEGLSLRQIAERLSLTYKQVRRRYERYKSLFLEKKGS